MADVPRAVGAGSLALGGQSFVYRRILRSGDVTTQLIAYLNANVSTASDTAKTWPAAMRASSGVLTPNCDLTTALTTLIGR